MCSPGDGSKVLKICLEPLKLGSPSWLGKSQVDVEKGPQHQRDQLTTFRRFGLLLEACLSPFSVGFDDISSPEKKSFQEVST